MYNWIRNGVEIGWLIHPDDRSVFVYRKGNAEAEREGPVRGLVLDLKPIWEGLSF